MYILIRSADIIMMLQFVFLNQLIRCFKEVTDDKMLLSHQFHHLQKKRQEVVYIIDDEEKTMEHLMVKNFNNMLFASKSYGWGKGQRT